MIVRELLAVFGLQYDGAGEKAATRGIKGLQKQMDVLQTAAAGAFSATLVAAPFIGLAKLASHAQENLNLLQVVFGESADVVVDWSAKAGAAMGRSRYTMRELASEFGGLVGVMVGPGEQAAEMSMRLSELAVNLSSIRDISEERALTVLTSGLAGETESIKRFGVDLTVAAQEAEALRMGLQGKYKDLDKGQKAQVRYNIIMRDLAYVQGDAAKTIDQFANSWRAMRDLLKDAGTELGFFLLPAFESTMKFIREGLAPLNGMVRSFREWAAETNLAKGALAGVALVVGTLLLPLMLKLLPLIIAFGVFVGIADEIITTFEGGDSVLARISEWLDAIDKGLPGVGSKLLKFLLWPLNRLRDITGALFLVWSALFEAIETGSFTPLKRAMEGLAVSAKEGLMEPAEELGNEFIQGNKAIGKTAKETAEGFFSGLKAFLDRPLEENFPAIFGAGGGTAAAALAPSPAQRAVLSPVQVLQGNRSFTFYVEQRPGESSEDFAHRVAEIANQQMDARDQDVLRELVPAVAE